MSQRVPEVEWGRTAGKVVIGVCLDAPDDRTSSPSAEIIMTGSPGSWIALEQREDVIAADAGHHQIEQDEIEGLFFDQGERAGAILRRGSRSSVPSSRGARTWPPLAVRHDQASRACD